MEENYGLDSDSLRALEAFRLYYLEGLKLREIGEKMGRIDGTGSFSVPRARQLRDKGQRMLDNPRWKNHPLRLRVNEIRAKAGL